MHLLDSRNRHPLALAAFALAALTPVAFYMSTRGISQQGHTANFESTDGQLVAQGDSYAYTYRVENKEYTGTRMSFLSGGDKVKLGGGISVGESVRVYYNPMNPQQAVLSPGTPLSAFTVTGLVVVGMPLLAAGLWFYSRQLVKESGNAESMRFSPNPETTEWREAA